MQNTALQFSEVINQCRDLFSKKLQDYGAAWRVLPSSVRSEEDRRRRSVRKGKRARKER